jgi:hypothetical protein
LTSGGEGAELSEERVAFLVGTSLPDAEGTDPEGGGIVFVFDGAYRALAGSRLSGRVPLGLGDCLRC